MGYISPMTNYQYTQYVERDNTEAYDPFYITAVAKTNPLVNTGRNEKGLNGSWEENDIKSKRSSQNKISSSVVEEIYSDITGKGRYFNECV
jgi:hypothetical protein